MRIPLPAWITGRTEERPLMPAPTPPQSPRPSVPVIPGPDGPWAGPRPGQPNPGLIIADSRATDDTQRLETGGEHRSAEPDPITDSSVHYLTTGAAVTAEPEHATHCPSCGGKLLTEPEILAASAALLGDRLTEVVPEMYRRLFILAPRLIPLFEDHAPSLFVWHWPLPDAERPTSDDVDPRQWIRDDQGERFWTINPDAAQVDMVFGAVKAVVALFDARDEEKLERLNSALNVMGRKHLRFDPPAGWAEYGAVIDATLSVLRDFAGDAWNVRLERAWVKALEYISAKMIEAQALAVTKGPGRRRRTG